MKIIAIYTAIKIKSMYVNNLISGLREATEGIIKKKQTKALSPWEEYLQKKKDKKERKREERTNKQERLEQQLEVSISLYTGVIFCP